MADEKLSYQQKLELLTAYMQMLPPRWALLQNYVAMYFSITLAMLGFASVQALEYVKIGMPIFVSLSLLPAAALSFFAVASIKRQNIHIRELIVVVAKLEQTLGLYDYVNTKGQSRPWKDDVALIPQCWIDDRQRFGERSDGFISAPLKGTSKIACTLFYLIFIISVSLGVFCLLLQLNILSAELLITKN